MLNIISMNGNHLNYAYDLEVINENSKSIYAEGLYGDVYRVEKGSKKVFKNGKQIASECEYRRGV